MYMVITSINDSNVGKERPSISMSYSWKTFPVLPPCEHSGATFPVDKDKLCPVSFSRVLSTLWTILLSVSETSSFSWSSTLSFFSNTSFPHLQGLHSLPTELLGSPLLDCLQSKQGSNSSFFWVCSFVLSAVLTSALEPKSFKSSFSRSNARREDIILNRAFFTDSCFSWFLVFKPTLMGWRLYSFSSLSFLIASRIFFEMTSS